MSGVGDARLTATEHRLRAIWQETLRIDAIRADDTFVDLGGDSISGTLCLIRVQEAFGVEIRLGPLLLDGMSLRELARRIDDRLGSSKPDSSQSS